MSPRPDTTPRALALDYQRLADCLREVAAQRRRLAARCGRGLALAYSLSADAEEREAERLAADAASIRETAA